MPIAKTLANPQKTCPYGSNPIYTTLMHKWKNNGETRGCIQPNQTLCFHYPSQTGDITIETIQNEVTDYIKQTNPREEAIQTWKTLSKWAETEARKLRANLATKHITSIKTIKIEL